MYVENRGLQWASFVKNKELFIDNGPSKGHATSGVWKMLGYMWSCPMRNPSIKKSMLSYRLMFFRIENLPWHQNELYSSKQFCCKILHKTKVAQDSGQFEIEIFMWSNLEVLNIIYFFKMWQELNICLYFNNFQTTISMKLASWN